MYNYTWSLPEKNIHGGHVTMKRTAIGGLLFTSNWLVSNKQSAEIQCTYKLACIITHLFVHLLYISIQFSDAFADLS